MSKLKFIKDLISHVNRTNARARKSDKYFSGARKLLEKETLSKEGYNRFIKSTKPFYEDAAAPYNLKVIDNTLYYTRKKINALNRAIKKGKRYGPDGVIVRGKGGMLTKNLELEGQLKKYKGHTDSFIYHKKGYHTKGHLEWELEDYKRLYNRYLNQVKNLSPPSYRQYRNFVKDTLKNTPTAISRGGKNRSSWGGVYYPQGSVRRDASVDVTRRLEELGSRAKGLKFGMARVKPSAIRHDKNIDMPYSTGVHELKHALQFNIRKTPGARPMDRGHEALDRFSRKFFKKDWQKEITKKGWHDYRIDQVPRELSARASELRALPKYMLDAIMKNPKKHAKTFREVRDIGRFTGYGHNFRNYLKNVWAIPVAYFGAQQYE